MSLCLFTVVHSNFAESNFPSHQHLSTTGGSEFSGPENGGPKRSNIVKCRTWEMTDQIAGLENATLENDGDIC